MTNCAVIVYDRDIGKLRCFIHTADYNRWLDRRKERVIFS